MLLSLFKNKYFLMGALVVILVIAIGVLYKISEARANTIKSLNSQVLELENSLAAKNKIIEEIVEKVNLQIKEIEDLNTKSNSLELKYKRQIAQLQREKESYENYINDPEMFRNSVNLKFNNILYQLSQSTGNRYSENTSE